MPGFYADGEYDVAGFIVGAVERARLVDGKGLVPGDVLLALPSVGLHTNGYSLARQIVFERLGLGVDSHVAALGETVGEALLRPHKSYLRPVQPLLARGHREGPGAHHRRRSDRQPAAHPARRAPRPRCTAGPGRCRRSSPGSPRPDRWRSTISTGRSTWASAWWSRSPKPMSPAPRRC